MTWYEWLAIAAVACILVGIAAYRTLRATRRGRRFLALSTRAKLRFGRALLRDENVPWSAKAVLLVAIGYLALPLDLIPDFIPVLGQLDDILLVALAMIITIRLVPAATFEAALAQAECGWRRLG